LSCFVLLCCVL
jgi:hypothetical protein